jgi:hypothetical protein
VVRATQVLAVQCMRDLEVVHTQDQVGQLMLAQVAVALERLASDSARRPGVGAVVGAMQRHARHLDICL